MTEVSASSLSEHTSDSSKTGSSKASEHSGAKAEPERDDGSSPIDMEGVIQMDRITNSLDKLVYQTKLAICMNTLINDNILANILTKKHLDVVTSTIYQYHRPVYENAENLIDMAAAEDILAGDLSLKNRVNPELCYMMYTLCSYPELKPHVERITEQLKKDEIKRNSKEPTPLHVSLYDGATNNVKGLNYLQKLEEFRDLMLIQMKTTAADELAAIINTRKLEKSNNESLEKIGEYKKSLELEKLDHEQNMREKYEVIEQLKKDLELNHHKAIIKRKKDILDSERQMVVATRAHVVKYEMLKEEAVENRDGYHALLHRSLLAEKQLRDRRRKCEVQLQSWLQKYDVEMFVKQGELDELIKVHEEEVEKIENLKIKLEEQNKEYDPLMAEKEAEYDQELAAKLDKFIIEHAARVIQTAWRDTLRNRAEKRKLLKLKKKIEAEKLAAELRAERLAKQAAANAKKQAKQEKADAKAAAKAAKLEAKAKEGEGAAAEGQETPAEGQAKE